MKFKRFPLASYEIENFVTKRFSSKRSLAAGKKAVKKQKEKWGLFYNELAEFKSAEERRDKNIEKFIKIFRNWRKKEAEFWKYARRKYFALNKEQREKIKFVYEKSSTPNKPERLADFIHYLKTEPEEFEKYYKTLKDLHERDVYQEAQIQC